MTRRKENAVIRAAQRILLTRLQQGQKVGTRKMAAHYCKLLLAQERRETVVALYLSSELRLIKSMIISVGTVDQSWVYVREVIRPAVLLDAEMVIVAHNHPRGKVLPSKEDREVTQKIVAGLEIFDIRLMDHFIIGRAGIYSFAEKGALN